MAPSEPDWSIVRDELVERLRQLVRIDTTNPPGRELVAAQWLAEEIAAAGLEPRVLESAPGRGSVVTRLVGTGAEPPLLLMSHLDVVPVEEGSWSHPPFGAEVHDGYIWGRGTLDTKNLTAQHLTVLLLCRRLADAGTALPRDLILMATADEEVGGELGASWLVDHHADLIRAEYALNEGGGSAFMLGGREYMTVQTAEKGLARFTLRARGPVGHASVPRDDNAVVRLAEAVAALGRARLPVHLTLTMREWLTVIAETQPSTVARTVQALLEDPARFDELAAALPLDDERRRTLSAALRNTATPTLLAAGTKVNVLPGEATARVDGRILPGQTQATFRTELAAHLPDGVELQFDDDAPPLEAEIRSPLYDAICEALRAHAPEVTPLPLLMTGATDAKAIVRLGTRVYGFGPMRHEAAVDGLPLVHGHDERISIDNLLFGAKVLYDVVLRFCGVHPPGAPEPR